MPATADQPAGENEATPFRRERPIPLAAVLSTFTGMALLIAFWRARRFFRDWPDSLELAFVTAASFLLVWGLAELLGATLFRSAASQSRVTPRQQPRLGGESWIGIVLISLGAGGLLLVRIDSAFGFLPIALLVVGGGLLFYGAKRFVGRMFRSRSRPAVTQRVGLTRPGAISLVIAVLLLVGAYLGPSNMLMLMFAAVVGPFIVNGWYAFGMIRRLTLKRNLPAQVVSGEPTTVALTLGNRKRRMSSWLMAATDPVVLMTGPAAGQTLVAETLFPRVAAREQSDAVYRLKLSRRGLYRFGPVRVRSRFPLGLVERSLIFDLPGEMIVAPRLGRLTDRWQRDSAAADELVQRQQPRRGAFPDEFEKLRSFRYGDNPRMIHWRSSARQNSLMVREFHEVRDRDLLLLLDLAAPSDASELQVETAVSFAATIGVDQLRRSRHSEIAIAVAGRAATTWTGIAHPSSAESMLRMLALVEAAPAPDLQPLWDFARERRTPATAAVLVTTRPAEAVARPASAAWIRVVSAADALSQYFVLE